MIFILLGLAGLGTLAAVLLRRRPVPRWRWPRCVDCRQLTAPAEMRGERCRYCEGRRPRCARCRQITDPAEMRDHRCPACVTAWLRSLPPAPGPRRCPRCQGALPPSWPWRECSPCTARQVAAILIARRGAPGPAMDEAALRKIWDRVEW